MDLLNSHPDVQAAINTFSATYGAHLPPGVREKFLAAQDAAPPMVMANVPEVLYANRALITDEATKTAAMTLAGQCALWCANPANRFNLMDARTEAGVSRGVGIWWAMQRELGEPTQPGIAWPDPSADPPPDESWIVQE